MIKKAFYGHPKRTYYFELIWIDTSHTARYFIMGGMCQYFQRWLKYFTFSNHASHKLYGFFFHIGLILLKYFSKVVHFRFTTSRFVSQSCKIIYSTILHYILVEFSSAGIYTVRKPLLFLIHNFLIPHFRPNG